MTVKELILELMEQDINNDVVFTGAYGAIEYDAEVFEENGKVVVSTGLCSG